MRGNAGDVGAGDERGGDREARDVFSRARGRVSGEDVARIGDGRLGLGFVEGLAGVLGG